ncbi:MAG: biopolymer transporter Tol [Jaaginema sp. PMC 1079.18]|nr:biopolymer transporter Tol [Jaaginema sp. PMC 1080.18]MEC4852722.1 biopolymer transporter Tol [Jaaginema sp. PMC 1079.18]MEC4867023.1 biopolymer transporter Tol [Jaaginema sp. PMC 1078.18]
MPAYRPWWRWAIASYCAIALFACSSPKTAPGPANLNSRYNDEQPTLSGDGRWLAFVSNRNGTNQIVLYDLRQKRFLELPGLNPSNTLTESPSLSLTGRYLTYLTYEQGRAEIALYDRIVGQTQVLTQRYNYWVRNPQISPDGRYIVFETSRRGQWDIEVLDRGSEIELDIPEGALVEP